MIQISKAGKYLQFNVDGVTVKYDLSTGDSISPHGNVVKSLAKYFRGRELYHIIDSFDDENYKRWFHYVRRQYPRYTNMGSLLAAVRSEGAHLEQFYTSGVKLTHLNSPPTEPVDSKLIRALKKFDIGWSSGIQALYDAVGIDHFNYIVERGHKSMFNGYYGRESIRSLLADGYDVTSLIKYVEYLQFVEGITANEYLLRDLNDYWDEVKLVSRNPSRYPRNFKTVKAKTSYHYRLNKDTYDEVKFELTTESKIDRVEWANRDYTIVYPTKAEEIREEGTALNHCVASYVDKVCSGDTHIVFMRATENVDEALVTVQLSPTYQVLQSRGENNRELTPQESAFLTTYEAWVTSDKAEVVAKKRAEARAEAAAKVNEEAEAISEAHPEYEQVA